VLVLLILSSVLILWLTVLHILYHLLLIENRVNMIHLIELLHLVVIFLHHLLHLCIMMCTSILKIASLRLT
jgi:hypothetical protein